TRKKQENIYSSYVWPLRSRMLSIWGTEVMVNTISGAEKAWNWFQPWLIVYWTELDRVFELNLAENILSLVAREALSSLADFSQRMGRGEYITQAGLPALRGGGTNPVRSPYDVSHSVMVDIVTRHQRHFIHAWQMLSAGGPNEQQKAIQSFAVLAECG